MSALDDLATSPFHDAEAPLRARMLSRLADTELAVALVSEPRGETLEFRIFALEDGPVALACDGEDRLAGFLGGPVAYAALPGRVLAAILRTEGTGLLVNPGAPSEILLDAATLDWLAGALTSAPETAEARLRPVAPDPAAVAALAEPLAARLSDLRGLVSGAALAGIAGRAGHLLLISGASPDHQPAIAKALAETLAFLPPQPGGVDISFSETVPPTGALRFDLPPDVLPDLPKGPKGPPILR